MIKLHIPGMSCQACVGRITRAVQESDPEASLAFDLDKREASIASTLDQTQLVKLLDDAGYDSTPFPSTDS